MSAAASSVVELVFQGVDRTGEATQAALSNAQKFSSTVQNIAAPIADATVAAIKFEAAILATGVAITTFSIKAAGDFDGAFREISTLVDAPIDELQKFRQAILDYSTDSTASLDQITSAVYNAISAGVEYTDSLEFLRQAEQLSIAGRAGLEESLTVLVSTLNAYGLGAEDAARFSDLLFTTVKQGQTTLPELAGSLANVTGLAATAGVGFDELLAAIATLTSTGTPTSQAITQIQGAIAAILKPTEQAQSLAKELGIEFNIQRLEAVGLEGILKDVAEATGGNSEQMARLFGRVEALNGVLTLTGLGADKFAENLLAMDGAAGATGDAYEKMAGAIEQSNQRLSNALRGLLIEIGTPLLDEYGSVTSAIAAIFNALGVSVQEGQLGGLVEFIESVMADLAGVLEDVARNLPAALESADLSGFTRNIEAVLDGVRRLLTGIDFRTEDGLKTLIEGVGNAFGQFGVLVGEAIANIRPLLLIIKEALVFVSELDEKWLKLGGTIGGTSIVLDTVLPKLDSLLLLLIAARGFGIKGGATAAAGAVGTLGVNLTTLAGILSAGGVGFAIGTYLVDPIDEAVDRLTGSGSLGGAIYDFLDGYRDRSDGIFGVGNFIGDWILDWGKKTGDFSDAIEANEQKIRDMDAAWGSADDSISSATDSLGGAGGAYGELNDYVGDANEALRDFAESQGFVIDEAGRWRELKQPISEIAPVIRDAEAAAKGYREELINGVKVFTQVGDGVVSVFEKSENAGQSFSTSMGGTLSFVGGQFESAAESAEEAFKQTDAYFLKLLELASDERIALIEAKVSLDIAELEADTERVIAAFDSINNVVSESYNLLGDLFGLWAMTDSAFDQAKLESFIKDEQRRLDEQLELQKKMVEAQINLMDARASSLDRGDGLIQIDGAGLQPHLEGFMWEILRTIQVRVNEDGLGMLLGCNA